MLYQFLLRLPASFIDKFPQPNWPQACLGDSGRDRPFVVVLSFCLALCSYNVSRMSDWSVDQSFIKFPQYNWRPKWH